MKISPYIALARIDSWSKNLIVFLGAFLAHILSGASLDATKAALTFFSVCLASSANYVLNESLDAKSDAYHPIKKKRASVKNKLNKAIIIGEYALLFLSALLLAYYTNPSVAAVLAIYLICAWLYNIPPIRFKDKAYLDVMLESINYPLRVLLGWFCVLPETIPPSSLMIVTWSIGAFTMSLKRLAEFQLFRNQKAAALYRRSYSTYTTNSLSISGLVYALFTVFGATILLLKYKIELVLMMPPLIALLAWYFSMGLKQRLFIIYPERLLKSKMFLFLCLIIFAIGIGALQAEIPFLNTLATPLRLNEHGVSGAHYK